MVRRRSPSHLTALPDPLPDGWTAHDGSARPVPAGARPGLWMRSGMRIKTGAARADHWEGWQGRATGSCWTWEDDGFDILAWRAEE